MEQEALHEPSGTTKDTNHTKEDGTDGWGTWRLPVFGVGDGPSPDPFPNPLPMNRRESGMANQKAPARRQRSQVHGRGSFRLEHEASQEPEGTRNGEWRIGNRRRDAGAPGFMARERGRKAQEAFREEPDLTPR